jgi:hypothetical protein
MTKLNVVEVSVAAKIGAADEGLLVYSEGTLVAILVRLDAETAAAVEGTWFAEIGFGPVDAFRHPVFESLEGGLAWIANQLAN